MDYSYYNLTGIINEWCGAEAASYRHHSTLKSLWLRSHPVSPPYNPDGVTQLLTLLRKNQYFTQNKHLGQLRLGYFTSGGGIQTVEDLHDFLNVETTDDRAGSNADVDDDRAGSGRRDDDDRAHSDRNNDDDRAHSDRNYDDRPRYLKKKPPQPKTPKPPRHRQKRSP